MAQQPGKKRDLFAEQLKSETNVVLFSLKLTQLTSDSSETCDTVGMSGNETISEPQMPFVIVPTILKLAEKITLFQIRICMIFLKS